MPTFNLTLEEREQIREALGDLTGQARRTERGRLRSKVLRQRPDFRQADNAAKAARGKERYHENLEESRRKGAEKWRRHWESRASGYLPAKEKRLKPIRIPQPRDWPQENTGD